MFNSDDLKVWNLCLSKYEFVLKEFAAKRKKNNLVALDNWFQNFLSDELQKNQCITKEQLEKIMEWKLNKGKFRPSLSAMIKENESNKVLEFSKNALNVAKDDPQQAIKELCKLRAVGPATASAILTAFDPERFAFMSDESVQQVLPGKIKYTLNYYEIYLEKVLEKARDLTIKDKRKWTPHNVEIALWSSKVSKTLKLDLNDFKVTDASEVKNEQQFNNLALVVKNPMKRELDPALLATCKKKKKK